MCGGDHQLFPVTPEVALDLPVARRRTSWAASGAVSDKTDGRTACRTTERIVLVSTRSPASHVV